MRPTHSKALARRRPALGSSPHISFEVPRPGPSSPIGPDLVLTRSPNSLPSSGPTAPSSFVLSLGTPSDTPRYSIFEAQRPPKSLGWARPRAARLWVVVSTCLCLTAAYWSLGAPAVANVWVWQEGALVLEHPVVESDSHLRAGDDGPTSGIVRRYTDKTITIQSCHAAGRLRQDLEAVF